MSTNVLKCAILLLLSCNVSSWALPRRHHCSYHVTAAAPPRSDINNRVMKLRCDNTTNRNYWETGEDQQLRLFWENQTFEAVEQILNAVILSNQSAPLLVREQPLQEDSSCTRSLFSPLFDPSPDISSSNTISSSQSRKKSFRLEVAYRGSHFCGFQTQPNNELLPSVQQSLEELLQSLSRYNARVDIRASGRTDAGVSALGQVCRFRSLAPVTAEEVLQHVNECPLVSQGSLRCMKATRVPESFHPTFGCTKRAYAYLMDPADLSDTQVDSLDRILQRLEGKELDYVGLSYGRVKTATTLCTLDICRASKTHSSIMPNKRVLCIELVADRFLRRMIRILVSTALRLVTNEDESIMHEDDAMLDLVRRRDRKLAARPAPPDGLIFVGATVN